MHEPAARSETGSILCKHHIHRIISGRTLSRLRFVCTIIFKALLYKRDTVSASAFNGIISSTTRFVVVVVIINVCWSPLFLLPLPRLRSHVNVIHTGYYNDIFTNRLCTLLLLLLLLLTRSCTFGFTLADRLTCEKCNTAHASRPRQRFYRRV